MYNISTICRICRIYVRYVGYASYFIKLSIATRVQGVVGAPTERDRSQKDGLTRRVWGMVTSWPVGPLWFVYYVHAGGCSLFWNNPIPAWWSTTQYFKPCAGFLQFTGIPWKCWTMGDPPWREPISIPASRLMKLVWFCLGIVFKRRVPTKFFFHGRLFNFHLGFRSKAFHNPRPPMCGRHISLEATRRGSREIYGGPLSKQERWVEISWR